MKGKFEHKESRGLPGGPNEMFTYVTGVFSTEGYKSDSPDVNNPFNVIPSGNITMKGVDFPVMGTDNLGNTKLMKPGKDYKFPGDMVFEVPMAQFGGMTRKKVDKILDKNKNLNFVQRMYQENTPSMIIPGQKGPSTHFMESSDNIVYPTVVQMPDGTLQYLESDDAYNYAVQSGEYIKLPNERQARRFGESYKKGTGVLKDFQESEMQQGGGINPKTVLSFLANPFAPLVSNLIQTGKENIAENMLPVGYENSRAYTQLLDGSSASKAVTLGKNVSKATNNLVDYKPNVTALSFTNRFGLPAINKIASAMFDIPKNKVEEREIERLYGNQSNIAPLQERQDLLNVLLGLDQKYNSIPIQDEYKPSKSKDPDSVYYKSPATESYIINQLQKNPQEFIKQVRGYKDGVNYWAEDQQDINTLGDYTINIGEDDKGQYISYYDIWDLQPFKNKAAKAAFDAAQTLSGLNTPEVYGRVYLKDFQKSEMQRGGQMNEEGQKQRNWLDSYIRSDKYLERLGKEMTGFMPGAYDANKVANERWARLMNLRNTPIGFLPESSDISPTPGDVQGIYDADEYPGMIMLRPEYKKGRQGPWSYNTTPLHEMGHGVVEGEERIPQFTKDLLMSTLKDNDLGIPKEEYYYTQPTEYINRLQPLRYLLQEEGIYDARTEDFTEKHLQKAKENTRIELNKHFQDLLRNTKSEKDLINLMNIIAMDERGQGLPTAQVGSEFRDFKGIPFLSSIAAGDIFGTNQHHDSRLADLYRYYAGMPLEDNILQVSNTKPTKAKDSDVKYISLNKNQQLVQEVIDNYNRVSDGNFYTTKTRPDLILDASDNERQLDKNNYKVTGYRSVNDVDDYQLNAIGNYFTGFGEDENGTYISYYDKFDQAGGLGGSINFGEKLGLTKPFEIYDRIYVEKDKDSGKYIQKKKEGGSVSWNWKDLPTAQDGKSIVEPTSKFISKKESERLGLKKEIDYSKLANNFDNFDVISEDESQTSSFNNQGAFTGGTTQDSLALYNNAMLSAKFYEQHVEDNGNGYKLRNTTEVGKNDVDEIFEYFNPDMLNRGARFMDKAKSVYNKIGSSDDRNKFINKDLIQAGDFSHIGPRGAHASFLYRDISPPALLHRNIKPDKWKEYYSDDAADHFDHFEDKRFDERSTYDIANVPVYDPVKVYPKSQGPVPKEAYKYSEIEEPKEFSRYVNIHGNNYGFNTAEEFINIARRKNLPQGWIDANIPKDLESQTKESIAKLQTGGEYTVKSGDTFDGIANKLANSLGVSKDEFIKANPGIRGKTLQINQTLNIPVPKPKEYKTFAGRYAMENLFAPGKPFDDAFSYKMFEPATELIKQREGYTKEKGEKSYIDSEGRLTGGVGHLLTEKEKAKYPKGTAIPQQEVNKWFEQDTKKSYNAALEQAEEIGNTDERLINALASVNFQLGENWYKEHKNTWKLLKEGKYNEAAKEAANSNWYKQTPVRVKDFQKTLMEIPNIKRQGGEVEELELYKSYINSDFDNKADQMKAQKIYDKLNRRHYKNAKQFGMSAPNYIMTYLLNNPNG